MKNIFYQLPKKIRQLIVKAIEIGAFIYIKYRTRTINTVEKNLSGKTNILVYHISALSFGGTEKNLQMIAKYLDKNKYNVFLMHGTKTEKNRLDYLKDTGVNIIHFEYDKVQPRWPYFLYNMDPKLETIINENKIDCIITATP